MICRPACVPRIKDMSEEERLPASQMVTLALIRFLSDLESGRVDLSDFKQPSRSPRYDWNLVLPEEWVGKKGREKSGSGG
jgi:hypothetical protein